MPVEKKCGDPALKTIWSTWASRCDRREAAEESVLLAVRTGREVDRLAATASPIISSLQAPQPIDPDLLAGGIDDRCQELAGAGTESVDAAVAEIADQNVAGKLAKARRSQRQAPRRIQMAMLSESL